MTFHELQLYMEGHALRSKDEYKLHVSAAFYGAYFNLKGQKGLKGKDLQEVLDKIDEGGKSKEMTELEILEACKSML